MKKINIPVALFLLILSCAPERGVRTYHLKHAHFPHPGRQEGFSRNDVFYPAEAHYMDSSVAVYVPDAYRKRGKTDLIIHFHGRGNNVMRSIEQFSLSEQLEASDRNMILVVPEGPKNAPDSFYGNLCDQDGFRFFIDELMDSLYQDRIIRSKKTGEIILSRHSGAYSVIAHILRHSGYTEKISEVFLFDALYTLEDDYLHWLRNYRGRFVHIYTDNGGIKDNSLDFMKSCDSLSLEYVHANTADIDEMPKGRILILYSDPGHSDVIAERKNLLKMLK